MTKEDAYRYARRTGQTHGLHVFDIDSVIDKIFNDLDKRVCGNCAVASNVKGKLICDRGYSSDTDGHGNRYVYKDFGCNEFEEKQ